MPSRRDYRRKTGDLHGLHEVVTNTVISSGGDLVTAAWPIRSQSNQRRLYEGYFLYRATTGETRLVKTPGGYDPTNGRLTPDDPFSTGLAVGEVIEVWGVLDPRVVNKLIDEVLALCYRTEEIVVPALDSVGRYDLTAVAPWLVNQAWVRSASWLGTGETRTSYLDLYERRRLPGEVMKIGGRIYWQGSYYSSDQDLYFLCVKREYDHCRDDGTGVFGERSGFALSALEKSLGLTEGNADDGECEADADWIAAGTMMRAWMRYARVLDQAANPKVKTSQEDAAREFSSRSAEQFELPERTIRAPRRLWGPPRRR